MTTHIKIYPAKASALKVHHPIAGAPHSDGRDWPYDVFTCRRLSDGSFTEDASKAFRPPPAEASPAPDKPAAVVADKPPASAADKPVADAPQGAAPAPQAGGLEGVKLDIAKAK
jgi:hypothetical protein